MLGVRKDVRSYVRDWKVYVVICSYYTGRWARMLDPTVRDWKVHTVICS